MKEKEPTNYYKSCPKCNKIIYYKHPQTLQNSIQHNWNCRKCVLLERRGLYTEQEEQFLIDNYSKLGRDECAKRLNRTTFSIGVKTSKMGLIMTPQPKDPINNQICGRCNVELNKSHFTKDKRRINKIGIMCKKCMWKDRQRPDKKLNKKKYDFKYKHIKKKSPIFKLRCKVKKRIMAAIKSSKLKKRHSIIELLGCSIIDFQKYLQSQFNSGMTWENYGFRGWHMDHKIPLSSAKTQEELEKLFHYTNIQPLWWYDNLSKKNKIL